MVENPLLRVLDDHPRFGASPDSARRSAWRQIAGALGQYADAQWSAPPTAVANLRRFAATSRRFGFVG